MLGYVISAEIIPGETLPEKQKLFNTPDAGASATNNLSLCEVPYKNDRVIKGPFIIYGRGGMGEKMGGPEILAT